MAGPSATIPYAEIDPGVRGLVAALNASPGITTLFSCAGHGDSPEGYVTFTAESQEAVAALVRRLPLMDWEGGFIANRPHWRAVWLNVTLDGTGLLYHLRFAGQPAYWQRGLIGEMEKQLRGEE